MIEEEKSEDQSEFILISAANRGLTSELDEAPRDKPMGELKPFTIRYNSESDQLQVGIPNNMEELLDKHYLCKLWYKALAASKTKYFPIDLDERFVFTYPDDANMMARLRGFGIVIANLHSEKFPAFPKSMAKPLSHGYALAVRQSLLADKESKINLSYTKVGKLKYPVLELVGQAWGGLGGVHRKLIDVITKVIKESQFHKKISLKYLLIPVRELRKAAGVNSNRIKSKVITNSEMKWLGSRHRDLQYIAAGDDDSAWKQDNVDTVGDVNIYIKNVEQIQKSCKAAKTIMDQVSSKRLSLIYGGLKGARLKLAQKKTVSSLISDMKGSMEYGAHFNPTMVMCYMSPYYPIEPLSQTLADQVLANWLIHAATFVDDGTLDSADVHMVSGWFQTWLMDYG
jgi:hypothetical protein